MKRRAFVSSSAAGSIGLGLSALVPGSIAGMRAAAPGAGTTGAAPSPAVRASGTNSARKILIAGGDYNSTFVKYMAQLTGKPRPRLCYLPTASADNPAGTIRWFEECANLEVSPFVQESFISSYKMTESWSDVLLSMDGIVCSGGNTLNQQAIWKAQGIDVILRQAWDKGIVLGGASAGSLCWFDEGTTDSRPKELSIVECLGFIKGSHCPHYDAEAPRRPLYLKLIGSGQMKPGYAVDNDAGIYFEDNEVKRVVATKPGAKAFYVSVVNGAVVEKELPAEMIA